jgi:hypothetical protein
VTIVDNAVYVDGRRTSNPESLLHELAVEDTFTVTSAPSSNATKTPC